MKREKRDYGIGWLSFYVRWRFPLGFVFGALSIIAEFGQFQQISSSLNNNATIGFWIGFGFDIIMYIFRIVVYGEMKSMTYKGYVMNNVLLVIETLLLAVPRDITSTAYFGYWGEFAIRLAVVTLLWLTPNLIYFSHRRYLFDGSRTLDELRKQENDRASSYYENIGVSDSNKFICKSCGMTSSGWYQTCPNCGAVGKMERNKAAAKAPSVVVVNNPEFSVTLPSGNDIVPAQKFCRKCGKPLANNAKFCLECGTPIVAVSASQTAAPSAVNQYICPSCGASLKPGMKFCNQCGVKLQPSKAAEYAPAGNTDLHEMKAVEGIKQIPSGATQSLNLDELPPKLRRAFMFIEDEEWDRAAEYLDSILDEEPENPYANLGKAMLRVKVGSPFDLTAEEIEALKKVRAYIRAKKYAEGSLKELFDYWEEQ